MPWSPKEFPTGINNTIKYGRELSVLLHCPIRLVSWSKPQYECWHGVVFPKFMVAGNISNNPGNLIKYHTDMMEKLHGREEAPAD